MKISKYDEDALFSSIVESAFEFLNKALDEFAASPKFSTVHFATAIELFLKARILKEHWSLLVEKTESAKRDQFFQGKLKTIGPDGAAQRLRHIACDPIPDQAEKAFRMIAQHRNRMVHFVHGTGEPAGTASNLLENVAAEQCVGWLNLHQLLRQNWSAHFSDYGDEIANVEQKMKKHYQYMVAKFTSNAPEIKARKEAGKGVRTCASCKFNAALVEHIDGAISVATCVVCSNAVHVVSLKCANEDCTQVIEFDAYNGAPQDCSTCNVAFASEVLTICSTTRDT